MSKRYYPVMLDLNGKKCAVIGGGEVALRKVNSLLGYSAKVKVISPDVCPELAELARRGAVTIVSRAYRDGDLSGAFLAIAATDYPKINRQIAAEAHHRAVADQDAGRVQRLAHGIPIPAEVVKDFIALGQELALPFPQV